MKAIVEADDDGDLTLPAELLGNSKPHAKYEVEACGERVILSPAQSGAEGRKRFWETATPEQWAEAFERWVSSHEPVGPGLSEEALRRENMYD